MTDTELKKLIEDCCNDIFDKTELLANVKAIMYERLKEELIIDGVSNQRELLIAKKGDYVTYIGGGKGKYLKLGKKYEVQKECNGEFIIVKNEIGRRQIYNTYFFSN